MTHLYAAEYVWLAALLGDDNPLAPGDAPGKLPGNQEGQDAMESVSDLQSHWLHLEERWESYLGSLQVANLTEQVAKKNSRSGQLHHTQRSDVLLHVCTHAQYTTAQAINMMRQLGVEPLPDPMLITMARQES
ncbi:MAG: hypothetical protein MI861_18600 [Pirellulales bacterium]|nr:hypothetical protein [Pirellulales bacterium]